VAHEVSPVAMRPSAVADPAWSPKPSLTSRKLRRTIKVIAADLALAAPFAIAAVVVEKVF